MADTQSTQSHSHRAVLIGADIPATRRPPNSDEGDISTVRSLNGAYHDVVALEGCLGPHVKTTSFVVPTSTTASENEERRLPTLDNVFAVLDEIIEDGQRHRYGFVYIHFSGHGTRLGNSPDAPLALVLYDPGNLGMRYFRGEDLARAVGKMVDHGMHVTLVLDCCFSGSVLRSDWPDKRWSGRAHIRFLDYDEAVGADSEAARSQRGLNHDLGATRDGELHPERLLDPEGYTIFAACGITETAKELGFMDGIHRGAFSYFFQHALRHLGKSGALITHESLFQHLQARFQAHFPQQSPRRYGSRAFSFFGGVTAGHLRMPFVFVSCQGGGSPLILSEGESHGVHQGDEYDAYASLGPESWGELRRRKPIRLVVKRVGGLTSHLEASPGISGHQKAAVSTRGTWKALAVMAFSPRKISVRVPPSIPGIERALAQEPRGRTYISFCTDDSSTSYSDFEVAVNDAGECEILDGAGHRISGGQIHAGNADGLVQALRHVATFKFLQQLENHHPDAEFEKQFEFGSPSEAGEDGWFEVRDGERWLLKFANKGPTSIYIAIFNFRESWEVRNLVWDAGEGQCLEIPPGQVEQKFSLLMGVPESVRGASGSLVEDTFKVFVTSRPTSYTSAVLPRLDGSRTRDGIWPADIFEDFAAKFSSTRDGGVGEMWATREFLVRTRAL